MAKRKAVKKAVAKATVRGKKKTAPKQSRAAAESVLRKGPVRKAPRTPALPGMENLGQIRDLDNSCRRLADIRHQMGDLRADEAAEMQTSLNAMRKHNRTSYRQHGVELVRVPGEEKLRVRTSKAEATAETEPEPEDVFAGDVITETDAGADEFAEEESLASV